MKRATYCVISNTCNEHSCDPRTCSAHSDAQHSAEDFALHAVLSLLYLATIRASKSCTVLNCFATPHVAHCLTTRCDTESLYVIIIL